MPPRGDRRVIREGEAHQRVHRQEQEHDYEEGDRAQPTDSQDRRPHVLENGEDSSKLHAVKLIIKFIIEVQNKSSKL